MERARCHEDARTEGAREVRVGLWSLTASCRPYSRRNHKRTQAGVHAGCDDISRSLEYVRRSRPAVVLIENVAETCVVQAVTEMVAAIQGYEWRMGELDPWEDFGIPASRRRAYWVGKCIS